jgi:hypothetical protein
MLAIATAQEPKQESPKKTQSKKEKLQSKEKMLASGKVTGKLTHVEGAQRYFVVQVKYAVSRPNLGAMQNIANLNRQLASARQNKDAKGALNAQMQLAWNQAIMYDVQTLDGPIEFVADDDMKIRTLQLPVEYDDKGKPRKLTQKELKERRGSDLSLPGYEADFDMLKQGQLVNVSLEKPSKPPAKKAEKKDPDGGDSKKERYKALMVVIVAEPQK